MESKLREALELVRNGTMCKHVLNGRDGSHCARGFLILAHGGTNTLHGIDGYLHLIAYRRDDELLGSVLSELFPDRRKMIDYSGKPLMNQVQVAVINNHPDTTIDDLILAFEEAAIRVEEMVE